VRRRSDGGGDAMEGRGDGREPEGGEGEGKGGKCLSPMIISIRPGILGTVTVRIRCSW